MIPPPPPPAPPIALLSSPSSIHTETSTPTDGHTDLPKYESESLDEFDQLPKVDTESLDGLELYQIEKSTVIWTGPKDEPKPRPGRMGAGPSSAEEIDWEAHVPRKEDSFKIAELIDLPSVVEHVRKYLNWARAGAHYGDYYPVMRYANRLSARRTAQRIRDWEKEGDGRYGIRDGETVDAKAVIISGERNAFIVWACLKMKPTSEDQ